MATQLECLRAIHKGVVYFITLGGKALSMGHDYRTRNIMQKAEVQRGRTIFNFQATEVDFNRIPKSENVDRATERLAIKRWVGKQITPAMFSFKVIGRISD